MSKKLLITGASGFVGYHLIQAALKQGFIVYAAVRGQSKVDHLDGMPIHYTTLDFGSVDKLKENIAENMYDYIIHAAAVTKARTEQEYTEINAVYANNLAIAAAAFSVKKFVFISSLAAIGPTYYSDEYPIRETQLPNPVTNYGRSKLLAERWISNVQGLPLVILRPTAVYGPREKDILMMFKTLSKGFEPYIGYKQQHLSFIYVKDLADIAIRILSAPIERNTYNLSDGKIYDRYALAEISKRILSKKTLKVHLPVSIVTIIAGVLEKLNGECTPTLNKEKLNELTAANWNCSIEKAKKELAFEPRYDLYSGLEETLSWYKEQNWL